MKTSVRVAECTVKEYFAHKGVIATNLGRAYRLQIDQSKGTRGIDLQDGIAELSRLITQCALNGVAVYIFPEDLPDAQGVIQKDQPSEIGIQKDDFDLVWSRIQ